MIDVLYCIFQTHRNWIKAIEDKLLQDACQIADQPIENQSSKQAMKWSSVAQEIQYQAQNLSYLALRNDRIGAMPSGPFLEAGFEIELACGLRRASSWFESHCGGRQAGPVPAAEHRFRRGVGGQRGSPGPRMPAIAVERNAQMQLIAHGRTFAKAIG